MLVRSFVRPTGSNLSIFIAQIFTLLSLSSWTDEACLPGGRDRGGYHRVQALCQLIVQLDVIDLEMKLALVSTGPHLEPEPLLELSPEPALVRGLHSLGDVVHPQGPVINVTLGRGALTDGQQATVHHEVVLNGLE